MSVAEKPREQDGKVKEDTPRKEEPDSRSPNQQLDKYMDPGRPYKCDVCRESFTQKSILLVHYNSVGHLRNLKRKMQEQQNNEQSATSPGYSTNEYQL